MGWNIQKIPSWFSIHVVACKFGSSFSLQVLHVPCSTNFVPNCVLKLVKNQQGLAWEREEAKRRTHKATVLPPHLHLKLCLLHHPQLSLPLHNLHLYCLSHLEKLHHCPTNRFRFLRPRHRLLRSRLVDRCQLLGQSLGHSWLCHCQYLNWLLLDCLCYPPYFLLV